MKNTIQLLDHHPTALELNKYNWCKVVIEENGEKVSGTSLFYNYLSCFYSWATRNLYYFSEIVRKYDTWLWKTKYNDNNPKMWNDLFYIMGRDNFVEEIVSRLKNGNSIEFTEFDLKLLEYKQLEIDKYIEDKSKLIIEKDILGYKAGIIFAESYHSELGNKLAENNPHLDFIVIINLSSSVSYRTIKDTIDLGKDIALIYNGGGHPKAAGSPLPDNFREKVIELLFK